MLELVEGNPQKLGVEMMCNALDERENYKIYRVLSQYEHSNGMGLLGSVIDTSTGNVSVGSAMKPEKASLIWEFLISMLKDMEEAVATLNKHRPES